MVSPRRSARRIFPRAATAGDMSSRNGASVPPGAPAANGLVPRSPSRPPQGGIAGDALENTSAMNPASMAGST
jgi:hypothetical protein